MRSTRFTFLTIVALLYLCSSFCLARVRTVEVHSDQVVTVKTSIGIATIIQVPDRPNSVVVGDQDSFKVEYLDQAITIKPLTSEARSNLYVYTDWKRYNVELVTGPQSQADYVVYLASPKIKKPAEGPIHWKKFKNSLRNENISLHVERIGTFKKDLLLVEFTLLSTGKEKIAPECFWITQNGESRPIQNLVLSSLEASPKKSVRGLLQLKIQELSEGPIKLEVRRKRLSYLTLPERTLWK